MADETYLARGYNSSMAVKVPCRLATTANHTLTGLSAIDGVTPAEGDRILVKSQSAPADNGIYVASSGEWYRAFDMDANGDLTQGTRVWVNAGTANGLKDFVLTTSGDIDLGTTSLTWGAALALQGLATTEDFDEAEFQTTVTVTRTDDSPYIILRNLQPNLLSGDVLASTHYTFLNANDIELDGAHITAVMMDDTVGLEDVRLQFRVVDQGVLTSAFNMQRGFWAFAATGGDKGTGTSNVVALYVQGELAIDNTGGINFPVYTSANIAAIGHAVNTTNKKDGKGVWDTTNNRLMIAGGSAANAVWYSAADPSTTVTPS